MFKKFKAGLSAQRLIDEKLYELVAAEMSNDDIKIGLWTKATADAEGNENKIKALYIKYRVQAMQDEAKIESVLIEEATELLEEAKEEAKRQKIYDDQRKNTARKEAQRKKVVDDNMELAIQKQKLKYAEKKPSGINADALVFFLFILAIAFFITMFWW